MKDKCLLTRSARTKAGTQGLKEEENQKGHKEMGVELEEIGSNTTFQKLMGLGWESFKNTVVFYSIRHYKVFEGEKMRKKIYTNIQQDFHNRHKKI